MEDFKLEMVLFLMRNGFVLGKDFSMDGNGDLVITQATFSALSEFLDKISDRGY